MNAMTITTSPTTTTAPRGASNLNNTGAVTERRDVLQAVYDKHVEQIYKFVYFKVGNREDAEDITSQVFMKAANSLDITQEDGVKLAWLYQVARTTITDHWRGYYRGATTSLEAMEEASNLTVADEPIYLGRPVEEETDPATGKVQAILEMLPENYRRVLQLRFLQGCTLKETAAAMSITEGNAKVLQHRALQKAVKLGANLI
jgi:RNA polymerase sigma-70 factor, ECF subfamily